MCELRVLVFKRNYDKALRKFSRKFSPANLFRFTAVLTVRSVLRNRTKSRRN